jgi:hypothetical protein
MEKEVNLKKDIHKMDIKEKLSTLWIVVMFNMIFADILSFITPGFFEELKAMQVNQSMLLIFAILLEIPILMIFLSRILNRKVNRWANIIAALITILFVIGGGSLYLHYIFFATIEIVCMLLIIWNVWKWKNS